MKKVFKRDIPLNERDDWESWHAAQRAEYARLTAAIVRLETGLNTRDNSGTPDQLNVCPNA